MQHEEFGNLSVSHGKEPGTSIPGFGALDETQSLEPLSVLEGVSMTVNPKIWGFTCHMRNSGSVCVLEAVAVIQNPKIWDFGWKTGSLGFSCFSEGKAMNVNPNIRGFVTRGVWDLSVSHGRYP